MLYAQGGWGSKKAKKLRAYYINGPLVIALKKGPKPFSGSSGSPGTRFRHGRPGFRGGPRPRPPRRTRRPQRPFRSGPPPCAPPQCTPSQSFFKRRSGKVNRKITKRQASSIPGNIIRSAFLVNYITTYHSKILITKQQITKAKNKESLRQSS